MTTETAVQEKKNQIKFTDVYDKSLNFLIGSGASIDLVPTLALNIRKPDNGWHTIESLGDYFKGNDRGDLEALLFMHYYRTCIKAAADLDISNPDFMTPDEIKNVENYTKFLESLLNTVSKRNTSPRSCNVFTTNYDGCLEFVADSVMKKSNRDFVLNDGARGFSKRYVHAKNYNSISYQTSIFEKHRTNIPQVNLIHVHGSVYWDNDNENIIVNYSGKDFSKIEETIFEELDSFSQLLLTDDTTVDQLLDFNSSGIKDQEFWNEYKKLPVVNPTKWKFHETVFEQHYYQMLRHMSYELEKPNTVLVTFGFSFADEHILQLIERSLSNPTLQVFVCCFNDIERQSMDEIFKGYSNVELICVDGNLTFTELNENVLVD